MTRDVLFWGLLLHFVGDYIIQTDRMANRKTETSPAGWFWAFAHAVTYTLPFLIVTHSWAALVTIGGTHLLIDHFRMAKWLIFSKAWLFEPVMTTRVGRRVISRTRVKWSDCRQFGFPPGKPEFIAFWLMIIIDNTVHIVINSVILVTT